MVHSSALIAKQVVVLSWLSAYLTLTAFVANSITFIHVVPASNAVIVVALLANAAINQFILFRYPPTQIAHVNIDYARISKFHYYAIKIHGRLEFYKPKGHHFINYLQNSLSSEQIKQIFLRPRRQNFKNLFFRDAFGSFNLLNQFVLSKRLELDRAEIFNNEDDTSDKNDLELDNLLD